MTFRGVRFRVRGKADLAIATADYLRPYPALQFAIVRLEIFRYHPHEINACIGQFHEYSTLVVDEALLRDQPKAFHPRKNPRHARTRNRTDVGDLARFHRPLLMKRADDAPLLFGQPMCGDQRAKALHHLFARPQQQHRQIAVQNTSGVGDWHDETVKKQGKS